MPTPSPSPMIRCPQEPPLEGGRSSASEDREEEVLVSQEMLWHVVQPFIGQMLEALVKSIRERQEQQRAAFRQQQGSAPEQESSSSPVTQDKDPDAFASLFDPPPDVAKRGQPLRRLPEDDEHLEQEAVSDSSSNPTPPSREVAPGTRHGRPQKVVADQEASSSRRGSKGSPALQGKEPSASEPQKVHSPSMPEMSLTEAMMPTDADVTPKPLYLSWQQQNPGAQRWADQRLSPTVSPMQPMAAPPGEGAGGAKQLVLSMDYRQGSLDDGVPATDASSPDAPTATGAEKSVMVCRHWKSKGFCKLEDKCKFLHPDHKRGPTSAAPKATAGGSSGGGANGTPQSAGNSPPQSSVTSTGSATSTGKRSRRSGRNRNAGGASSAVPSAQAVAVGPVGNIAGVQAPALGVQSGPS
jgi:hypothetical protein